MAEGKEAAARVGGAPPSRAAAVEPHEATEPRATAAEPCAAAAAVAAVEPRAAAVEAARRCPRPITPCHGNQQQQQMARAHVGAPVVCASGRRCRARGGKCTWECALVMCTVSWLCGFGVLYVVLYCKLSRGGSMMLNCALKICPRRAFGKRPPAPRKPKGEPGRSRGFSWQRYHQFAIFLYSSPWRSRTAAW